ncbi:tripartite tricarboxylate transporter TctB family protein [Salipiger mangrovisoli]|uniref:Tripartite tricarboxylate transporter TctB family protein n=1 Tax=Salipiger mangrovisoli TaxID=2865933 RepID=A0ABR9X972_9RHOB|nr:tripartite tricarboxylate transporter TctB family protein [Salipiger mangrovisoli]MBE9640144.1 tripartite tricarboxylate transporter TctB family protein [Salipiger mangrovisoli]
MPNKLAAIDWRDASVAVAVMALGLTGVVLASRYSLGEMRNIGPGAFPMIVSVLILLAGGLIAIESVVMRREEGDDLSAEPVPYRVLLFVTAGLLAFALLTPVAGAVPGILACILLAAMADGSLRLWQVAVLAALVAGFCALVFVVLLKLPMTLVTW